MQLPHAAQLAGSLSADKAKKQHKAFSMGLSSACLGRCPNCEAEGDLVDKVGQVVHQVEDAVLDTAHQISKEIAKRVDGPSNCHNETHSLERSLHMLVHGTAPSETSGLTQEDFIQDVTPSRHAEHKAQERIDGFRLPSIAEGQHCHSAKQQAPEHATSEVGLHRKEDQVELNHLQGHSNRPVNVTVEDGG